MSDDPGLDERLRAIEEHAARCNERQRRQEQDWPKLEERVIELEKSQARWAGAIGLLAFIGSIVGAALVRLFLH